MKGSKISMAAMLYAGMIAGCMRPKEYLPLTTQRSSLPQSTLEAVIIAESDGNPRASRYEIHLDPDKDPNKGSRLGNTSYGLAQFIPTTALELQDQHPELPRLGTSEEEIIDSLCNPEISRQYLHTALEDAIQFYQSKELVLAAHNSGFYRPRNARVQQQLNQLYNLQLQCDGKIGKKTGSAIKQFQKDNHLQLTGKLDANTYETIQRTWTMKYPGEQNPVGIIPNNPTIRNYVTRVQQIEQELASGHRAVPALAE